MGKTEEDDVLDCFFARGRYTCTDAYVQVDASLPFPYLYQQLLLDNAFAWKVLQY